MPIDLHAPHKNRNLSLVRNLSLIMSENPEEAAKQLVLAHERLTEVEAIASKAMDQAQQAQDALRHERENVQKLWQGLATLSGVPMPDLGDNFTLPDVLDAVLKKSSTVETTSTRTPKPTTATTTTRTRTTATTITTSTTTSCFGYDVCPEYPLPYSYGEWPTEYSFSGSFPEGFVWGLGTASYQIEGGFREGGRGASIWDTFTGANTIDMPGAGCGHCCRETPCPVNDRMDSKGATGNVACDHYHLWRSDVALMRSMGLKHYRFSVSWPRIVPTGRIKDGINEEGIAFYSDLLDALIAADITPWITLYHWDLPQGLLDPPRMNGWWSRDEHGRPNGEILDDWLGYVDVCFKHFGDRVKMWFTLNEAWTSSFLASGMGMAPGIEAFSNQSRDPYIAGHNMLVAHAAAVDLYRGKYQKKQDGRIGITNNCDWHEPATESPWDIAAAARAIDFQLGWFADPIFSGTGDYPQAMRRLLGDKMPEFTEDERRLVNGSSDFFGLNHYGTSWTEHENGSSSWDQSWTTNFEDGFVHSQSDWLYGSGWGFRKMLNYIMRRYKNPPIFVTEGGWSLPTKSPKDGVIDVPRMWYYANYTAELRKAIYEDGVDIRGYFGWSLMDNFEWAKGYVERFGVTYTDFRFGWDGDSPWISNEPGEQAETPTADGQRRYRKESSCWLEALWTSNALVDPGSFEGCVSADVFSTGGSFLDSGDSTCLWTVSRQKLKKSTGNRVIDGYKGVFEGSGDGCDGITLKATFRGGTVRADFGVGLGLLTGYWSRAGEGSIVWEDGKVWSLSASVRKAQDLSDVASILRPRDPASPDSEDDWRTQVRMKA